MFSLKKGGALSLFVVTVFFIAFFSLFNDNSGDFLTGKVVQEVAFQVQDEGSARVIVTLKEDAAHPAVLESLEQEGLEQTQELSLLNGFAAEVTPETLELLAEHPDVEKVQLDYPIEQALIQSRVLTNASTSQNTLYETTNITGKGLSACVIDSGVYRHAAFDTRILKEACYCSATEGANTYCCQDGNSTQTEGIIGDNNGHGTHTAGIIASADSTYKGIAPEAGIVSVKVVNSTGHGFTSDLLAGLEFCITNADTYNITVVSMSLGCSGGFTSPCDSSSVCDSSSITQLVNQAVAQDITLVAATGNSGSTSQILSPACIQNVTSVSSTTKADVLSSFSNRNSQTDLLAPGSSISSTYNSGGFATSSGTSQATPHVAGAILLLQHYKTLESSPLTSFAVQNYLNDTGFSLYDAGTGLTFSRISVYSALVAADAQLPQITLTHPTTTNYFSNISLPLNFTATDSFLDLVYYTLDNGENITLTGNITFNVSRGLHTLTIYAKDFYGHTTYDQVNFTSSEDQTIPQITIHHPQTSTYSTLPILINLSSNEDVVFTYYNGTTNQSYTTEETNYFAQGTITLIAYATDQGGNQNQTNVTFIVDNIGPVISFITPSAGQELGSDFLLNISLEDSPSGVNASAIFYRWENSTMESAWIPMTNTSKSYWHAPFTLSDIAEGTFDLVINASDLNGASSTSTLSNLEKDTVLPTQTGINALPGTTSATITWSTQEASNSTLDYGTSQSLGTLEKQTARVLSHSINVVGLTSNTDYYYNLTSCDVAGNCKTDGWFTFKTSSSSSSSTPSSSQSGGAGGGAGTTRQAETLIDEIIPQATLPVELERTIDKVFQNPDATKDLIELNEYEFEKKLIVKDDESIIRLNILYKGNEVSDFLVYVDVPKEFAEHASEVHIETEEEQTISVVKEDPSFMILYGTTQQNQERVLEISVKKTVDASILDSFVAPKIYSSTQEPLEVSPLTAASLQIQHEYGNTLKYWWIFALVFIIFGSLIFYYFDEIKHKLKSDKSPKNKSNYES